MKYPYEYPYDKLQKQLEDKPLAVKMLVNVTSAFAVGSVVFGFARGVPEYMCGGPFARGFFDPGNLQMGAGFAVLAVARTLYDERRAWKRPLLLVGMAGCVLALMLYAFFFGLAFDPSVGFQGAAASDVLRLALMGFFILSLPVFCFVKAFCTYVRMSRNTPSEAAAEHAADEASPSNFSSNF
jgi:hypothetical protein